MCQNTTSAQDRHAHTRITVHQTMFNCWRAVLRYSDAPPGERPSAVRYTAGVHHQRQVADIRVLCARLERHHALQIRVDFHLPCDIAAASGRRSDYGQIPFDGYGRLPVGAGVHNDQRDSVICQSPAVQRVDNRAIGITQFEVGAIFTCNIQGDRFIAFCLFLKSSDLR